MATVDVEMSLARHGRWHRVGFWPSLGTTWPVIVAPTAAAVIWPAHRPRRVPRPGTASPHLVRRRLAARSVNCSAPTSSSRETSSSGFAATPVSGTPPGSASTAHDGRPADRPPHPTTAVVPHTRPQGGVPPRPAMSPQWTVVSCVVHRPGSASATPWRPPPCLAHDIAALRADGGGIPQKGPHRDHRPAAADPGDPRKRPLGRRRPRPHHDPRGGHHDATVAPLFTQRILLVDTDGRPFTAMVDAGIGDVEPVMPQRNLLAGVAVFQPCGICPTRGDRAGDIVKIEGSTQPRTRTRQASSRTSHPSTGPGSNPSSTTRQKNGSSGAS